MSLKRAPENSEVSGLGKLDDFKGSDEAFKVKAAEAYAVLEGKAKKELSAEATPEQLKAKVIELAEPDLKANVSGNELSQKAADAILKSIQEAKDKQEFALMLDKQRDQLAQNSPSQGGQSPLNDKMTAVLMQILEKFAAMFGVKGLTNEFAEAAADKPKSSAPAALVIPETQKVAPEPVTAAVTSPVTPSGPVVTAPLSALNADLPERPAAEFASSVTKPKTFEEIMDAPLVKPGSVVFTATTPQASERFSFDIGASNLLGRAGGAFATSVQPDAVSIVNANALTRVAAQPSDFGVPNVDPAVNDPSRFAAKSTAMAM
jgi:hypothetical protein